MTESGSDRDSLESKLGPVDMDADPGYLYHGLRFADCISIYISPAAHSLRSATLLLHEIDANRVINFKRDVRL